MYEPTQALAFFRWFIFEAMTQAFALVFVQQSISRAAYVRAAVLALFWAAFYSAANVRTAQHATDYKATRSRVVHAGYTAVLARFSPVHSSSLLRNWVRSGDYRRIRSWRVRLQARYGRTPLCTLLPLCVTHSCLSHGIREASIVSVRGICRAVARHGAGGACGICARRG